MRKILLSSLTAASLLLMFTGCLKDKGYDNGEYGIREVEKIGLTFPQASGGPVSYALVSQTDAQTVDGVVVALESNSGKAVADIHIKLELNPTIVADNGLVSIPASGYVINRDVVIPAGQSNVFVPVTFPNTSLLDPNQPYGIGLTITSADAGYTIASNSRDVVMSFNIKNRFDGEYKLTMQHLGWAAYGIWDGASLTYPGNFGIVTAGANSFTLQNYLRGDEDLQPGFTSTPAGTGFGAATPLFTFDAANKFVSVVNTTPDDGRGRAFQINPAVTTSRYDPAIKTIYMAYIMKQNGRPDFMIYDTFTYVRPRQ